MPLSRNYSDPGCSLAGHTCRLKDPDMSSDGWGARKEKKGVEIKETGSENNNSNCGGGGSKRLGEARSRHLIG